MCAAPRRQNSCIKGVVIVDKTFSFRVDSDLSRFVSIDFVSIHFVSFPFARSIIRSFVRSIRVRFVFVSILSSIPYRTSSRTWLRSSITVHLLYFRSWIYCAPAALPRINSRADLSDRHIDMTTPTATLQEQLLLRNIHRILFRKLTVVLCCFVLFRWFEFNFKLQTLDLTTGRGANNGCTVLVKRNSIW